MTTWLEDNNGNKCSIEYFGSKETAQKALDSLIRCFNCINCRGCSDCSDCSGCRDCFEKHNLIGFVSSIKPNSKIPTIENIHQKILEAISQPDAFDMSTWHTCETTHCRAGWVVTLAGDAGKSLELFHHSTYLAAQLIYRNSSSIKVSVNKFFANNVDAIVDIKRCAELEANTKD